MPDLYGSEHPATVDHVAECSLASTVGATIRDAGDTGDGVTSALRLHRGLVTGELGNGIGLAMVLEEVGVDEMDGVEADQGLEDVRKGDEVGSISGHVSLRVLDRNKGVDGGGHHGERGEELGLGFDVVGLQ